jgi:hypothetical protein
VALAILAAAGLQLTLPDTVVLGSRWLMPVLELAVLAVLVVANPGRFERERTARRASRSPRSSASRTAPRSCA